MPDFGDLSCDGNSGEAGSALFPKSSAPNFDVNVTRRRCPAPEQQPVLAESTRSQRDARRSDDEDECIGDSVDRAGRPVNAGAIAAVPQAQAGDSRSPGGPAYLPGWSRMSIAPAHQVVVLSDRGTLTVACPSLTALAREMFSSLTRSSVAPRSRDLSMKSRNTRDSQRLPGRR